MSTGVVITLIIVAGVVLIALAGIAWLWSVTANGGFESFGGKDKERLDALEKDVRDLRFRVDHRTEGVP